MIVLIPIFLAILYIALAIMLIALSIVAPIAVRKVKRYFSNLRFSVNFKRIHVDSKVSIEE